MKNKKEDTIEKNKSKIREDNTEYGEFVSTYFSWIPIDEQKKKAKKLEKITSRNNDNSNLGK